MTRGWLQLFFSVCFLVLATTGYATNENQQAQAFVVSCLETFKTLAVNSLAQNYGSQNLITRRQDGDRREVKIRLGKRLGYGVKGSVYIAHSIEGVSELGSLTELPDKFVVKFPHRFRFLGMMAPFSREGNDREKEVYDTMLRDADRIAAEPNWYPKDPAWLPGRLPTAPIYAKFETEFGNVMVKPLVKGRTLGQIRTQYNPKRLDDLPPEMVASLREIYHLAQATYEVSKIQKRTFWTSRPIEGATIPLSLDINPTNLVWVDHPTEMKRLGLKRRSFVTYEFGEMPGSAFHHSVMGEDRYLSIVLSFIQSARPSK